MYLVLNYTVLLKSRRMFFLVLALFDIVLLRQKGRSLMEFFSGKSSINTVCV